MNKSYVGDGVYVEYDLGALTLTTENGARVTNTIVLEPDVYRALIDYASRVAGWGKG